MKTTESAGILLINHRGLMLLVEQDGKTWSVPKGRIEGEEPPLDCAYRELEEEGFRKDDVMLLSSQHRYERDSDGAPPEREKMYGVPPRMAQELMRHSDRRLTDQVYLDTALLPLQETMRSIDGFGEWTQIWTQISGETGQMGSRVSETGEEGEIAGSPLTVGSGRSLTQPVGRLRWRDRRDSNPRPPA